MNVKHVAWEPSRLPQFWWHPYDRSLGHGLHEAAHVLYGRDSERLGALRRGAPSLARLTRKALRGALGR